MLEIYLEESKMMKKRKMEGTLPPGGNSSEGNRQGEVTSLQGYHLHCKQWLVDLQEKCLPSKHEDLSLNPQHACAKPGQSAYTLSAKGRWRGDTGRSLKFSGPSAQPSYGRSHLKKTEVRKGMVVGGGQEKEMG